MSDRQFLQSVLNICATNMNVDWMFSELTPNEEFEEIYKLIFEHLNPPEQGVRGGPRIPRCGGIKYFLKIIVDSADIYVRMVEKEVTW